MGSSLILPSRNSHRVMGSGLTLPSRNSQSDGFGPPPPRATVRARTWPREYCARRCPGLMSIARSKQYMASAYLHGHGGRGRGVGGVLGKVRKVMSGTWRAVKAVHGLGVPTQAWQPGVWDKRERW
eukprot:218258-Chlamydomonas_euryale.AAC.2